MKVALLLANGFEEIEALTPLDVLRRAGVTVDTIGIGTKTVMGAHNIPVIADITDDEATPDDYDCAIFPGGMPGATNLDSAEFTDKIIGAVTAKGGRLAAICAAPLVLGRRGLLDGKKTTCYPGFEGELKGARTFPFGVVTDGNITTAKGMGVALEFAKELTSLLVSRECAENISEAIMENAPTFSEEDEYDSNSYLYDKKFLEAVEIAITNGAVATSLLQRKLHIGYGKAAQFIDVMEELGIISERCGAKARSTLISLEEWHKMLENITENE